VFDFSFMASLSAATDIKRICDPANQLECLADSHTPGPCILTPSDIRTEVNAVLLADLES
jgi:hypothetical protein